MAGKTPDMNRIRLPRLPDRRPAMKLPDLAAMRKALAAQRTKDVNQAVSAAVEAAKEFYGGAELKGILLEEVEMADNGRAWLITLGFNVPDTSGPSALKDAGILPRYVRKYKTFKVDAKTGIVTSMKIREV